MKTAMMIDGNPVSRSTASWIGARSHGGAYSSRKTAMQTPSGSAMRVATPTRIADPTISGAIPPPGLNGTGRSLVRKLQESSLAPRLATARTTSASTASAASAASVAIASASAVDDPSSAHARIAPQAQCRLEGGHQRPPVPWTWKRRTMTTAIRFVTRPITSRIAAR